MSEAALRVVFAPDLLGAALFDKDCRTLLNRWRDGAVIPAVSRELLLRYLRLFHAIGLPQTLARRWACWLTSPKKSIFLEEYEDEASPPQSDAFSRASAENLCLAAARASGAKIIACWRKPAGASANGAVKFTSASELVLEIHS